jgi:hypothetical protein
MPTTSTRSQIKIGLLNTETVLALRLILCAGALSAIRNVRISMKPSNLCNKNCMGKPWRIFESDVRTVASKKR